MQSLLFSLVPIAIIFLGFYALYALVRTLFSRPRPPVSRFDVLLVFIIVLAPFAALVKMGIDGQSDALLNGASFVLAGMLFVSGLIITLLEALRPPRLRGSRGILMIGGALLLGVSSVLVPYMAEYIALDATLVSSPITFNTPVNVVVNSEESTPAAATMPAGTLDATQIALATQEYFRPIFDELFNDIYAIIGRETGLGLDAILTALDQGESIAQLVEANDGDMEGMIADITARLRETITSLAQQGVIPRLQAAFFLSQLEVAVRFSVENDVRTLLNSVTGEQRVETNGADTGDVTSIANQATPSGTSGSLFAFLTVTATPSGAEVETAGGSSTLTPLPTLMATLTLTPSPTPSPSRTPRPTATPTNTRALFVRPTATATPTLPSPCVALMNYNVNMRREPDSESELIVTIPYETAITAFGRDEDSEWWFAEYEGQAGWIKGEFITTTASCEKLPVRR